MDLVLQEGGIVTKEKTTFKVGDFVNYRNSGICEVKEIVEKDFGVGLKTYYILKNVYEEDTVVRIPIDSKAVDLNMRRVLTKKEINQIITDTESSDNVWIDDYKKRATKFEEILAKGNRSDILWMIKVLSIYKVEAKDSKRKFGVTDEKLLEQAEKMIVQEFSFILKIDQEEVIPYITKKVEKLRKGE